MRLRLMIKMWILVIVSKSSSLDIRDLRRTRKSIDPTTASTIATSLIHSKVDNCNSFLLNLPATQISRLQLVLNSAALAVTRTPTFHHFQISSLAYNKPENSIQGSLSHSQIFQNWPSFSSSLFHLTHTSSFYSFLISHHTQSSFCHSWFERTNRSFIHSAPV